MPKPLHQTKGFGKLRQRVVGQVTQKARAMHIGLTLGLTGVSAPSLITRALSAIRRNNGSLLLPGAATPALGGELVTNGDGSSAAGWSATNSAVSVADGRLVLTNTGGAAWPKIQQSVNFEAGKSYLITATGFTGTNGHQPGYNFGPTLTPVINISGVSGVPMSWVLTCTTTGPVSLVFFAASATATAGTTLFDNISVKQILSYTHGNPALRNYLDSAGTGLLDSVTQVDQPVGLCLDSMGVSGAELVTNGDFSAGATGWADVTGAWAVTGGAMVGTSVAADAYGPYFSSPSIVAGRSYQVTFTVTVSSGSLLVRVGNTQSDAYGSTGTYSRVMVATTTGATACQLRAAGAGFTGTIDNISVREIPGAHASQPTTASKPLLRRGLVNRVLNSSNLSSWQTTAAGTITGGQADPDGGTSAQLFSGAGKNVYMTAANAGSVAAGVQVTQAIHCYSATAGTIHLGSALGSTSAVSISAGWGVYTFSWIASANDGPALALSGSLSSVTVYRQGFYHSAVTASQIQAAGGIPTTTTAAASSARGGWAWQFDGSNDSFSTSITTGNEGWVCSGVTITPGATSQTVVCSGAGTGTEKGVFLVSSNSTVVYAYACNGTARSQAQTAITAGTPQVVSMGWSAAGVVAGVNNTESNATAFSGDVTGASLLRIGQYTSGTLPLNGPMSATVYCPVLPSAADRALIRRFVGTLNGQLIGYGPELVTNGTFDTNIAGWTLSGTTLPTWSASGLVLSSDGSFFSRAQQSFTTVVGRTYALALSVVTASPTLKVDIGTTAGASDVSTTTHAATGPKSSTFVATSTTTHIEIENGITASPVVDSISVREVGIL